MAILPVLSGAARQQAENQHQTGACVQDQNINGIRNCSFVVRVLPLSRMILPKFR